MTSKKERHKRRRQAERQMEEAWVALEKGNPVLAERSSRRSIEAGSMNPRLWREHGLILLRCGHRDEGEEALRRAIAMAPTYADAFADLARLQSESGKIAAAERLSRRVVELRPESDEDRARWRELHAQLPALEVADAPVAEFPAPTGGATERFAWDEIESEIAQRGVARLPALFDDRNCARWREAFADEDRFEWIEAVAPGAAQGRALRHPLDGDLAALRAELLGRLAPIATRQHRELGRRPPVARGEARRSAVLVVRVPAGAPFSVEARGAFPFALQIDLGPPVDDGAFALTDLRPGKRRRAHRLVTRPGDAVVYCVAERRVSIAGVAARQPVATAREPGGGVRFLLEMPFEDLAG